MEGCPCSVLMMTVAVMAIFLQLAVSADDVEKNSDHKTKTAAQRGCSRRYSDLSANHTRCLTDSPLATAVHLSKQEQRLIVNLHNDYRAGVNPSASNMMKLKWDTKLAKTAQKWALQCFFDHDRLKDREEPDYPGLPIGQNIGINHKNFSEMLHRFYTEKDRFNYQFGGKYVKDIGHFYQMVTHETTRVGCAAATCQHDKIKVIRVCNYAPALDAATPPYTKGPSCGDCRAHCDKSGKLCNCRGKVCFHHSEIDPSTCQCKCNHMWTGKYCEIMNCSKPDPLHSCRDGRLTEDQCGMKGSLIEDPNMCPHLCRICEETCGGLECHNGGTLNTNTCTCACEGLFTGPSCEACPAMDKSYCTKYRLRDGCHQMVPGDCPIYCGFCHTSCEDCLHQGDLNTTDCSCKCKGDFSGPHCELCPEADKDFCGSIPLEYCDKQPSTFYLPQTLCPYRCGIC